MKKYLETNDKTQPYKIYGMKQKLFLEEVPSNEQVCSKTGLPQKNRKTSNKQPKLPPKRIRKEQTKIREKINKIETKNKNNKTKN